LKTTTFSELNLLAPIQQSVEEKGYTTPTPVQAACIPHLLERRDLIGCAQTGTGKTAAFALPILHRLGEDNRKAEPGSPRVLVLAPTRELAAQIGQSFADYGRYLKLRQTVIFGGVNQSRQVRALNKGIHILVATPGRLLDLMNQGFIKLDRLEVFVLDEADRMLDMGFLPDLRRIIDALPKQRHSLFFSATMPPKITDLANRLLKNPVRVDVTPATPSVKLIEQNVIFVERRQKQDLLKEMVTGKDVDRALVFTRTKRTANMVAQLLRRDGVNASAIHGNKSQNARTRTLEEFRSRKVTVLVATDLASRGIDIDGITHVINFELPSEPEDYVHRIGRTGRAGASGVAYTFCSHAERNSLRSIERLIGQKVPVAGDRTGGSRESGSQENGESRRPGRKTTAPKNSSSFRHRRKRTNGSGKKGASPQGRKPGSTQSQGNKPAPARSRDAS